MTGLKDIDYDWLLDVVNGQIVNVSYCADTGLQLIIRTRKDYLLTIGAVDYQLCREDVEDTVAARIQEEH